MKITYHQEKVKSVKKLIRNMNEREENLMLISQQHQQHLEALDVTNDLNV